MSLFYPIFPSFIPSSLFHPIFPLSSHLPSFIPSSLFHSIFPLSSHLPSFIPSSLFHPTTLQHPSFNNYLILNLWLHSCIITFFNDSCTMTMKISRRELYSKFTNELFIVNKTIAICVVPNRNYKTTLTHCD